MKQTIKFFAALTVLAFVSIPAVGKNNDMEYQEVVRKHDVPPRRSRGKRFGLLCGYYYRQC